jgi:hypothetical protein
MAKARPAVVVTGLDREKTPVPMAGGFDKIHALPPGGPAPRMADGHVDLTGRWYPDAAGRMLQFAYPVDQVALQQFDPKVTPEVPPVFNARDERKVRPAGPLRRRGLRSGRHSQHDPWSKTRNTLPWRSSLTQEGWSCYMSTRWTFAWST